MTSPRSRNPAASEGLSEQVLHGISRNGVFLLAGQITSRAIGFLYILVLARWLEVADFGRYTLIVSFLMIATTGVEFGLGRLVVRDLARDPNLIAPYLSALVPLRAGLACAGYLGLLGAIWVAGYSAEMLVLTMIAAISLLPTSLGLLFDALFHARQQMRYSALGDLLIAIVQLAGGSAVLLLGGGLTGVLIVGVGASATYMVFLAWQARARGYPIFPQGSDSKLSVTLLRQAVPFAVVGILVMVTNRAELLILGVISDPESIAVFGAAAKFPEIALLFPIIVASAAAPVISKLHASSREDLGRVYLWANQRLLWIMLPVTLAGVVLAESILGLLFPPAYHQATPILQILFCTLPLASVHIINSAVLTMSKRPRLMLLNAAVSAGIQFSLGLILISYFGLFGAALSAAVSQVLNLAFSYWCIRVWFVDTAGMGRLLATPAAAGAVSVALTALLSGPLGVWSLGPGVCAYAIMLGLLNRVWPAGQMPASTSHELR